MLKFLVKSTLFILLISGFATAQTGQQSLGSIVKEPVSTTDSPIADIDEKPISSDPVQAQLDAMSMDQKIAQIFIVPLQGGLAPNSNDRQFLKAFPPGGILIMDVTKSLNAITLIKAIHETKKSHGIPILIGTDVFAPSDVERSRNDLFLRIPSMTAIAAANQNDVTLQLFDLVAEDLSLMGFDFHLGPNLQLASSLNPTNSLYNFGSDPIHTGELSVILGNSLKKHNVEWMPAGFPGGGSNKRGESPAVLLTPQNQLFENDLWPYDQAIELGINMIHVSNTLVPTLEDKAIPASLSHKVMTTLLRQGLSFEGLILAGPLDDPNITSGMESEEAVMLSLTNGADMILLQEPGIKALQTITDVSVAIQEGRFDIELIDNAVKRIIKLKIDMGLEGKELPKEKSASQIDAKREDNTAPYIIDRSSITLLKNTPGLLPLDEKRSFPVVLTGVDGVDELQDELEKHFKKIFTQKITSAKYATRVEDFEIERVLELTKGGRIIIYILTNDADMTTQYQLLQAIKAQNKALIVVLLDYPKNPRVLEPADAIVLAYQSNHSLSETLHAVSDVLMGNAPMQILPALNPLLEKTDNDIQFNVYNVIRSPLGRLPIHMSKEFPAGKSVTYKPVLAIKKVEWDFGDGRGSSEFQGSHAYREPGAYTVTLTIKPETGEPFSGTFPIIIE